MSLSSCATAAAIAGVVMYSRKLKTTAEKAKVIPLRPTAASCADPKRPTNAVHERATNQISS